MSVLSQRPTESPEVHAVRPCETNASPALALLIAATITMGLGWTFHRIGLWLPADDIAQTARELNRADATVIRPEPEEWLAYLCTLLAIPGIFLVVRQLHGRLGSNPYKRWDGYLALLVLALAVPALLQDLLWRIFLAPVVDPVTLGLAAVIAIAIAILGPPPHAVRVLLFLVLAVVAAWVTTSWRIFGLAAVDSRVAGMYIHYDAFVYSVSQALAGGTCLADILPQYGCYAEFLSPILRVLGYSTLKMTLLLTLAQLGCLVALVIAIARILRSTWAILACVIWLVIFLNLGIFWSDPYFQSMPARLIFPALGTVIATRWRPDASWTAAFLAGSFCGLAIAWNLDSGAVVFGAVGLLILFSGCTSPSWSVRSVAGDRALLLAAFAGGAAVALALFVFLLSLKAGRWIDLSAYTVFQRVFAGSGYNMLPMPPFPSAWIFVLAPLLATGTLLTLRIGRGPFEPQLERAAFVAVLGAGLFSYYVGRSHPIVLALVTWPSVIVFFFLLERLPAMASTRIPLRAPLLALLIALPAMVLWRAHPQLWVMFSVNCAKLAIVDSPIQRDAAFIRDSVPPRESISILALNHGTLFAETGLRSALPGPSLIESLRRIDVDRTIEALIHRGPRHLFLAYEFTLPEYMRMCCDHVPWLRDATDRIRAKYSLQDWSPTGNLMHLVRRDFHPSGPDLFEAPVGADARADRGAGDRSGHRRARWPVGSARSHPDDNRSRSPQLFPHRDCGSPGHPAVRICNGHLELLLRPSGFYHSSSGHRPGKVCALRRHRRGVVVQCSLHDAGAGRQ